MPTTALPNTFHCIPQTPCKQASEAWNVECEAGKCLDKDREKAYNTNKSESLSKDYSK